MWVSPFMMHRVQYAQIRRPRFSCICGCANSFLFLKARHMCSLKSDFASSLLLTAAALCGYLSVLYIFIIHLSFLHFRLSVRWVLPVHGVRGGVPRRTPLQSLRAWQAACPERGLCGGRAPRAGAGDAHSHLCSSFAGVFCLVISHMSALGISQRAGGSTHWPTPTGKSSGPHGELV